MSQVKQDREWTPTHANSANFWARSELRWLRKQFTHARFVRACYAGFGGLIIWDGMLIGETTASAPKIVLNTIVGMCVIVFPFFVVFPRAPESANGRE